MGNGKCKVDCRCHSGCGALHTLLPRLGKLLRVSWLVLSLGICSEALV